MPFLMTSKVDSNPIELLFSCLRCIDGSTTDLNGLELNLSRHIINKILSDQNFDYNSLKDPYAAYFKITRVRLIKVMMRILKEKLF